MAVQPSCQRFLQYPSSALREILQWPQRRFSNLSSHDLIGAEQQLRKVIRSRDHSVVRNDAASAEFSKRDCVRE